MTAVAESSAATGYPFALGVLGAALIIAGMLGGGWQLLLVWLGANFAVLGFAHARGRHRIMGKRPDGRLAPWGWLAFFPLLVYTLAVWHLVRLTSREPKSNTVTPRLVVGRRLLDSEVEGAFANYVDLTSEFTEPPAIRRSGAYFSFPVLDGGAPTPQALRDAVRSLRPGRTFIHCAQGHGRTGTFAIALLLESGEARATEDAARMVLAARPGIVLSKAQKDCLEAYARNA